MNTVVNSPKLQIELAKLDRYAEAGYFLALHIRFTSPLLFYHTFNAAWMDHYSEQGYVLRDPLIAWAFTKVGCARWSDDCILDPFDIIQDAHRFDLRYGVTISAGPIMSRSVCSIARSDREHTDGEIAEIEDVLLNLHQITEPKIEMTKAQIEALKLIAGGCRYAEAAYTLGISVSALKLRLLTARERLKARTTPEAIQRAKDLNIF